MLIQRLREGRNLLRVTQLLKDSQSSQVPWSAASLAPSPPEEDSQTRASRQREAPTFSCALWDGSRRALRDFRVFVTGLSHVNFRWPSSRFLSLPVPSLPHFSSPPGVDL